jgi:hypothetical protein
VFYLVNLQVVAATGFAKFKRANMETGVSAWQLRDGCRMFEYRLGAEPGGLYTTIGLNLANSGQKYRYALMEVFTAVGLVTILGKMELF